VRVASGEGVTPTHTHKKMIVKSALPICGVGFVLLLDVSGGSRS
jgi:hypothetical protein